jgi:hypothetical protein
MVGYPQLCWNNIHPHHWKVDIGDAAKIVYYTVGKID